MRDILSELDKLKSSYGNYAAALYIAIRNHTLFRKFTHF